jgi:hypothetical protein
MEEALPTAIVTGYEKHISATNLPDPDDRHVVAAGIASNASLSSPGTFAISRAPAQRRAIGLQRVEAPHEQVEKPLARQSVRLRHRRQRGLVDPPDERPLQVELGAARGIGLTQRQARLLGDLGKADPALD